MNSTTTKHLYNGSAILIDSYDGDYDTSDWWVFPQMMPVTGIGSMVTCAHLLYTRDYLMAGIRSIIKPDAMENLMPFSAQIHTVMLRLATIIASLALTPCDAYIYKSVDWVIMFKIMACGLFGAKPIHEIMLVYC